MRPTDGPDTAATPPSGESPIRCDACQSAIDPEGEQDVGFFLLDHLTIPVLGCEDHLDRFASICGLTSGDDADVLNHRPAGGIRCPGCRNARYNAGHAALPVGDGAIVVPACAEHQAELAQRFQSGLATQSQLTAEPGGSMDSPF